ncbi:type VI secretion system baseplate subunit TssE [Shewanella sp. OPT22]|uniref:type VI secretion system baseplate subunit TssE n=1 Tax=Parashewanella hymeniacidonis TaxID=2807618 RepID=UPI0010205451|nr:type VI secretion system baseplate subunit TssE [Parashewanella hymeniacidonis]MBM7071365.1 type VI secretion system baseplate subunit TssE [Parashewanella hymeniacidonis]RYV01394.1 type VI secretion system baseplate subunit TssE [Shewanella sp. OPT22]
MSIIAKLTQTWEEDIDALRDSIIDNVCALVSSRAPLWDEDFQDMNLNNTIANYGVRYVARSQSKTNIHVILSDIRALIQSFEPRLSQVSIELSDEGKRLNTLQFNISAVMHSPYGAESMVFDSVLDLSSNKLDVRKSNFV